LRLYRRTAGLARCRKPCARAQGRCWQAGNKYPSARTQRIRPRPRLRRSRPIAQIGPCRSVPSHRGGCQSPRWPRAGSLGFCHPARTSAALMVLVPMPAEDDGDILLSGKTGKLLNAMLAAFGIDSAQIYRASALPARIALPDWAAMASAGLGAVLAHHVALVSTAAASGVRKDRHLERYWGTVQRITLRIYTSLTMTPALFRWVSSMILKLFWRSQAGRPECGNVGWMDVRQNRAAHRATGRWALTDLNGNGPAVKMS